MRIVQLTKDFSSTGGVARYVLDLTEALRAAGHTVGVVHADADAARQADLLHVEGVADFDREPAAERRVRPVLEFLGRFEPDVVHVQGTNNYLLERAILDRFPTCKTMHVHEFCPTETKFHHAGRASCRHATGRMCLPRMVFKRCTLTRRPIRMWAFYQRSVMANRTHAEYPILVVASDYVKRQAVISGYAADRLRVIPCFTRLPDPRPDAPPIADPSTVLFCGRLTREKGLGVLLAALRRVGRPWRLVVVGDGPERPRAERQVRRLGLSSRVEFRGWLSVGDLDDVYRRATVVVVPSLWPEPFGLVGIEAMSHARPVVAFDVGGISEWLQDGDTGYLVPPYAIDRLADRLSTILNEPVLARAMGARGRALVARRFTATAHLAQLLPVYERLGRLWRRA